MISIITIFLNAEKFLQEAIDSIFAQTFTQWELLLVDDGSTDDSSRIAKEATAQHPDRIRYLEHHGHRNLGMSASRNLGIQRAKFSTIALLDSDDEWFPTKLKEQLEIFERHPDAMMVYGNNEFWKSWSHDPQDTDFRMELGHAANRVFYAPELLLLYFLSKKIAAPVPSDLMFRREMALRIGGFENAFRNMYEDQVFLIKAFAHEAIYVSSNCWTRYRQHSDSFVARWNHQNSTKQGAPPALEWAARYLAENGFRGSESWRRLQQVLFRCRHPLLFRAYDKLNRFRVSL